MSEVHNFYYQYCRKGHMLYSRNDSINQKHCQHCGESFLYECEHCNAKIPNSFRSIVFLTSKNPVNFPNKPDFCISCGKSYPWTSTVKNIPEDFNFWDLIHPTVTKVAKKRYEDGHYADAVETALKVLNNAVKKIYQKETGEELDGVALMRKAFAPQNPVIKLDNLETQTGKSIQQGYMDLYAGVISGIRNPKAHDVIEIDKTRAIHHLFVTSLLFYKLDERP